MEDAREGKRKAYTELTWRLHGASMLLRKTLEMTQGSKTGRIGTTGSS